MIAANIFSIANLKNSFFEDIPNLWYLTYRSLKSYGKNLIYLKVNGKWLFQTYLPSEIHRILWRFREVSFFTGRGAIYPWSAVVIFSAPPLSAHKKILAPFFDPRKNFAPPPTNRRPPIPVKNDSSLRAIPF